MIEEKGKERREERRERYKPTTVGTTWAGSASLPSSATNVTFRVILPILIKIINIPITY